MAIDYKKLSNILVESGLLEAEALEEAKQKAIDKDIPLEKILVDEEYIADDNLGQVISDLFEVPYVKLQQKNIEDKALRIIPELVAKRQKIITFDQGKDGIKVAMADPENQEMINYISKKTGEKVKVYYATVNDINEIVTNYRKGIKEEFDDIIKQNIEEAKNKKEAERELPVTKIVDTVLEYAYDNKVSDIHIEPHEKEVIIRFRIDGILHDVVQLPTELHPFVVTRLKILSKLRTDEHRSAQDGRLDFLVEGGKVDVRISIVPVSDGEKVVMRLLSEKSRQFNLTELGLAGEDLEKVKRGFKRPHGMILATGPTGSGKTTTLYSILKILNKREVNIATIEDPVEYDIDGVNQIQVQKKTNLTFASGLRSILRQDPDIVMVGEIRDEETASIAINAAMTGHLVLSTLHTNDAPTTLPRLLDMKIEPFLIASTINVAIAQRLVRKIHQACMESYKPNEDEMGNLKDAIGAEKWKRFKMDLKVPRLYKGMGCKLCNQTGYEGRIGIYEVMEMSEEIRRLIMKQANSDDIRTVAIAEGMTTMFEDGLKKVLQGSTTIEEILRATRDY
ncbi:MAG: GspE/PulE family protein [Candidatus Daviesbacteria bacterium]|nr:GspE/PulE family protein [Candidatus Daviesbacteria bacterium]